MINSSSDNVKKLGSINRRMFITGSLKFFIMVGIVISILCILIGFIKLGKFNKKIQK